MVFSIERFSIEVKNQLKLKGYDVSNFFPNYDNKYTMIKKFKISDTNFTFVFKRRCTEKYSSNSIDYRFGIFYKTSKIVGKKNFNIPQEWKNNLINDYTIGIDLIIFQTWICFNIDK